jgi:hypothetical protein
MPVGAAGGTPQYSGTFVGETWSAKILVKFWDALILPSISNADYAIGKGEGDTCHIRVAPTITTQRYYKNMKMTLQIPETTLIDLLIDYARAAYVGCDDIDAYQSNIALMNEFSDNAGMQIKQDTESDIFADIYPDSAAYNEGATAGYISRNINLGVSGTPLPVTSADVLQLIVKTMQCLDEYSAPKTDRWGVIAAWLKSNVMLSELKDASLSGDGTSIMRNGRMGRIADCTLYESNKLTTASDGGHTCFYPMFGQKRALCFATNISKTDRENIPGTFESAIKILTVCGWKVLKGEALVVPYVYEG